MSVITTGSYPKGLWPGVKDWWGMHYDRDNMQYQYLFDAATSNKSYEEFVETIGMGLAPRKAEGTAVQYDSMQQGVTNRFTNVTYALGYIITEEEMEDNQYEQLMNERAADLGISMRTTKETVAANYYSLAFTTTFADGVPLISTAHPVKNGGTQSNALAIPADLSETAIEDLVIQIKSAEDSSGRKIAQMATKLIIPNELEFTACRITKSILQNDTANNAVNALRATGAIMDGYYVNQYLTDADAWFLRTNNTKGMTWLERKAAEFTRDNDFDTSNNKHKGRERYVPAHQDWRGIYGTPGAT